MRILFLTQATASILFLSAAGIAGPALAQTGQSQMERDSEKKSPAAADAALARDEASVAKKRANGAAMAARSPKAKKAASQAARAADAASREAKAATQEASKNSGMAPH